MEVYLGWLFAEVSVLMAVARTAPADGRPLAMPY